MNTPAPNPATGPSAPGTTPSAASAGPVGADAEAPGATAAPGPVPDSTSAPVWRRYVAIGDSFTEGMNDLDPTDPQRMVGWADRLAGHLDAIAAARGEDFAYANLAIRGRLLADITDRQLPLALDLRPDLVSIVGGGNDILRPRADLDALAARLEAAVARIRATGADVLMATPTDPAGAPVIRAVRGRHATMTAHIWTIARRHCAHVIDQWGLRALGDWRMWSDDRIHMTPEGHRRVALAALAALGHDTRSAWGDAEAQAMAQADPTGNPMPWAAPPPPLEAPPTWERLRGDGRWAATHLAPWVRRRLTGRSSGDHRSAKRPVPGPLDR